MTLGLSAAIANDVLDALCRNDAVSTLPKSALWIKLHIGDPGSAGASNAATNTTRKQATFGSAAAGGAISNTALITWTPAEVIASEDYTHWSAWTASTAGTFIASGLVTANAVTAGDQFQLAVGDVDVTINTAA